MRRKRTGMLGTLRMAQGNSIDDIDQRILEARLESIEISSDFIVIYYLRSVAFRNDFNCLL